MIKSRILTKVIALLHILTFTAFCIVNAAAADSEWKTVYSEDFSGSVVSGFTSSDPRMQLSINNGELEVSSDSLCYMTVDGIKTNGAGDMNSHGLRLLYSDRLITKASSEMTDADGRRFLYHTASSGDNSVFFENVGGSAAIKQFTFMRDSDGQKRTNISRFAVSPELFEGKNNLKVKIEYYISGEADSFWTASFGGKYPEVNQFIKLIYANSAGTTTTAGVPFPSLTKGEWAEQEFELHDVDFTRFIPNDGGGNTISFKIETPASYDESRIENPPGVYIRRISIAEDGDTFSEDAENRIAVNAFTRESLTGDVRLSYDMILPSGVECGADTAYNTPNGRMSVSLRNENDIEVAAVEYDILNSAAAAAYLRYTDANGASVREPFADIEYDRKYRYTVTTNWSDKKYHAEIADEDGNVIAESELLTIDNESLVGRYCLIKSVSVGHNSSSAALLSRFDNMTVECMEDEEYKNCLADSQGISLGIAEGRAKSDFVLPMSCTNGSSVSWESGNQSAIRIDGHTARVTRAANDTAVTLTARVTSPSGRYVITRDFEVIVTSLEGTFASAGRGSFSHDVRAAEMADGTLDISYSLENCGPMPDTGSKEIQLLAVITNTANDDVECFSDLKTVNAGYSRVEFALHGVRKPNVGEELKYYLWDGGNLSMLNNPPSAPKGFEAVGKVSLIDLKWDQCFDDNNAVSYEVYRNGELIAETTDNFYKDTDVTKESRNSYKVIAVDSNRLEGGSTNESEALQRTDYVCFYDAENDTSNGITHIITERDPYSFYIRAADRTGAESRCISTDTNNHYIEFAADKSIISGTERKIVIEVTYLDTNGKLALYYNSVIPDGQSDSVALARKEIVISQSMGNTREWKTVLLRMPDAQFRASQHFSSGDFGFRCSENNSMFIKCVKVIQQDLYE